MGIPECPDWLTRDAKECWARTAPQLEKMRILSLADRETLAGYCQSYSDWKQAKVWLKKNGTVHIVREEPKKRQREGPIKYTQQWPQVSIAERAMKNGASAIRCC